MSSLAAAGTRTVKVLCPYSQGHYLKLTLSLGECGGVAAAVAGDGDIEQQLCSLHHPSHQALGLGEDRYWNMQLAQAHSSSAQLKSPSLQAAIVHGDCTKTQCY